jgi:nucleoside phosphorylase
VASAKELFQKKCYDLAIIDLALPTWEGGQIKPDAGIDLIREISSMKWFLCPKSILAITQHEECYKSSDILKQDLGVVLFKYDANKSIREYLSPFIKKAIKTNIQLSYDYDVCIIGALEEETNPFKALLSTCTKSSEFEHHDFYFYDATINHEGTILKIALVTLPRMGLVSSTATTMKALNLLKPKFVVMPGICAGIQGQSKLGDLILAETCWEWQSGKLTENEHKKEPYQIQIDDSCQGLFYNTPEDYAEKAWKDFDGTRSNEKPNLLKGAFVTGSSVIADSDKILEISTQHRKLLGLDMEIFGMYYACSITQPRPVFLAIKSVCDLGNKHKGDSIHDFCAKLSAGYIYKMLLSNIHRIKST